MKGYNPSNRLRGRSANLIHLTSPASLIIEFDLILTTEQIPSKY